MDYRLNRGQKKIIIGFQAVGLTIYNKLRNPCHYRIPEQLVNNMGAGSWSEWLATTEMWGPRERLRTYQPGVPGRRSRLL